VLGAGVLDALIGDSPRDGKAPRPLAELEIDAHTVRQRSIVEDSDSQHDAKRAARVTLPVPSEVAPSGGDHLPFGPNGLGRDFEAPEQIARRKGVTYGAWRE
jgi:hypothetical protein